MIQGYQKDKTKYGHRSVWSDCAMDQPHLIKVQAEVVILEIKSTVPAGVVVAGLIRPMIASLACEPEVGTVFPS